MAVVVAVVMLMAEQHCFLTVLSVGELLRKAAVLSILWVKGCACEIFLRLCL